MDLLSSPPVKYFTTNFPSLTDEDVLEVLAISKLEHFPKGYEVIPAGECRKIIAFILNGIVRAYYINENGQEMTPFFWAEDQIFASWEAIYLDMPSQLYFETLEPCTLLITDFVKFKSLVVKNNRIMRAYLEMMEVILTNTLIHQQSFKNEKPETRYQQFFGEMPEVANRISQKYIASFLGITPISLSRMKKRMTSEE